MSSMSDKEYNKFRISIRSQSLPKPKALFNQLSKDQDNDHLSDHKRGVAWRAKRPKW